MPGPDDLEDHYQTLDLSPSASKRDIEKAWKEKRLKCHPDKAPEGRTAEYTTKFQVLQSAYHTLSDAVLRSEYDDKREKRAATDRRSRDASPASRRSPADSRPPSDSPSRSGPALTQTGPAQARPQSNTVPSMKQSSHSTPLQPTANAQGSLKSRRQSSTATVSSSAPSSTTILPPVANGAHQATFSSAQQFIQIAPGYGVQNGFMYATSPPAGTFFSHAYNQTQSPRYTLSSPSVFLSHSCSAPLHPMSDNSSANAYAPADLKHKMRPRSNSDSPWQHPSVATSRAYRNPPRSVSSTYLETRPAGARRYYPLHDKQHLRMALPGVGTEIQHSLSPDDQSFLRLTYLAYKHGVDIVQYPLTNRNDNGYTVEWPKYGLVEVVLHAPPAGEDPA